MSGLGSACGGVQVLFVEEDGTYRIDEAALRRVSQHEAARGLPVAVVSVAGATRGGKSFLLDFFLRYLRAPEAARRTGAWIGADDEPLTGFDWRGGWKRNTIGILLWSEPIVVTLEVDGKKKKIAVILMDTQGTFDNTSTVKDCTTIFAMSTLISSVQIYNLAQIIREDDLQHLQLFTEYGKLARTKENVTPFQSLIFRVRDWACPYEHPYGAQGGETYLRTILQASTKKREIIELRDHIRSSFETVSCFLTPHPGMAVVDQNFSGRLCDLQADFKASLLEFVPLIFHPSKLIPKIINGNEVQTGELPTYFRTYLEIFNNDQLPTPVSILQATSLACLENALSASREAYSSYMESRVCVSGSVRREAVPLAHGAALDAARSAYASRRTLAAPVLAAARLDSLLQELDATLPHYIAINHAKILNAVSESRAAYEEVVRSVRGDRPLCLHPLDAPVLHAEASAAAMAIYSDSRHNPNESDDPDRDSMLQWVDAKGQELRASNELNNAAARASACAVYSQHIQQASRGGVLGADRLQREHAAGKDAALAALRNARLRYSEHSDEQDPYLNDLIRDIEEQFERWRASSGSTVRAALRAAAAGYNSRMAGVWGPHTCLHPRALQREHASALQEAREQYRADTAAEPNTEEERQLVQTIECRHAELRQINHASNDALVTSSYGEYCRLMDVKCAPSLTSILIVPWVLKILLQLPKYHEQSVRAAITHFESRRRCFGDEGEDDYIKTLKKKLSDGFEVYCNPIQALARELNIPT